jgi:hypothetical protein
MTSSRRWVARLRLPLDTLTRLRYAIAARIENPCAPRLF